MPQVATEPDLRKLRLARAAEVLRLEARTIAQLEHRLDDRFARAVELVLACDGMVVVTGVGKAGLVGQKLSATLASTGTPSIFLHPTEALHGDLGRIRAQDLVLALTGVSDSTLARHADCVLDIGKVEEACPMKLAPTASTSALLAMGDALAMVVLQERDFSREDYALYHPGGMLGRKLMKVKEVMRQGEQLPLVKSGTKLAEVVRVMNRTPGRPGAALVVDGEEKLVGIFTHGDLARMLERNTLDTNDAVDLHMGKTPKTILGEQLVEEAQHLLHEHRIDQIAVVDATKRAIGLLDVQDLLDVRIS